ncbi:hypothetical protein HAX54_041894 [Datura stramonium]|uniref:Uncharacterized protein n=1 Tax=Datura stramonium TaxID=4076 RepID=A0ABS8VZU7_DATST|nr:hypothetical protein [Datura stramonium]
MIEGIAELTKSLVAAKETVSKKVKENKCCCAPANELKEGCLAPAHALKERCLTPTHALKEGFLTPAHALKEGCCAPGLAPNLPAHRMACSASFLAASCGLCHPRAVDYFKL